MAASTTTTHIRLVAVRECSPSPLTGSLALPKHKVPAFVAVATRGYYANRAKELATQMAAHCTFKHTFHIFAGKEGPWPLGTITRPSVMLNHWRTLEDSNYIFCIDADMRVEARVTDEILDEIVATQHPGYVGQHRTTVPYDRNKLSRAFVKMGDGDQYYAGGFYGGERDAVRDVLMQMEFICEPGLPTPRWHDESALNRCLIESPPTKVLSPAYCHPDNSTYYHESVWQEDYPRIIVALDKPEEQRHGR